MNKKIFKKIASILAVAMLATSAFSQTKVSGVVKDAADSSPVAYATAALLRTDSSVVTGVITNNDGQFVIENVAAGNYLLQVSFIGYEKEFRTVNVPAQSDLGEILLSESANKLQEVVVSATRPLVVSRADRYIVNVAGNIQSAGRGALDILRNTPGLLVDKDGNVSVMGNNVQIWIDGRPSRMSGEQLQAFLNSMQGGEIDRIEVITNPSSRYEAEGSGGIIDIRTRRGLEFGVNGTVTAGYKQGRTDSENAGLDLNWRSKKLNVYGNYVAGSSKGWERINQINESHTADGVIVFNQNAIGKSVKPVLRHAVRTGMDYFLNQKNTLGIIVNAYQTDGGKSNLKGNTLISPALNGINRTAADNVQSRPGDGIQVNANYQATFQKPGQQLNFDMDYARFNSKPFQHNTNRYYDKNGAMAGDVEQLRNSNPQSIDVYSAKIDYVQPLWKNARMETGAKISQSKTDNDIKFEVFASNGWQIDNIKTNRFVYTEQIDAGYLNISQQVGKFSLQAGLRGEYTKARGEQKTTGAVNDTTYFNLFPTFFVNWQALPQHTFSLSYSRRLSRPQYFSLNPFEVAIDAYYFTAGNPYLTPAYTHNFQLSHMFAKGLMTRIGYTSTTDLIMQKPVEDAATQRHGLVWSNFGRSQQMYAMINYRRPLIKFWTANLTVQGGYFNNTSEEASGQFVNRGVIYIAQLNNNLTITPTLSAEITGMYMSKMRQGYLVAKPQGNLSAGLRQTLMKNKLTLSLMVNDILFTSKIRINTQYDDVNYYVSSEQDSRYVNLTVRYNFGASTVKAARNRTSGIEEEAGRAR